MTKKPAALFMALTLVMSLAACSNTENQNGTADNSTPPSQSESLSVDTSIPAADSEVAAGGNSKILIAFFTAAENSEVDAVSSASVVMINNEAKGTLKALADMIAEKTNGDLFSVQTNVEYPAGINELIDYAATEQENNDRPELTTVIENLDEYDTIFVGYPNWWYDMPMVMYSFFEEYDFSGKTIIPFNAHNGSRFSRTIETIQELEPGATVITDGFTVSHGKVADAADDIASWLEKLGY